MVRRGLILLGLIALSTTNISAADRLSDVQIERELIGSWIVPPSSTDYNPAKPYSLETFKPDGTYTYVEFRDATCRATISQTEVKWTIENGVLVTILPNGRRLRDEVLNIENGTITLHSLEDGTTYTREKALTCSKVVGA